MKQSYSYTTIKDKTKVFFLKQLEKVDTPDYGWRDYQFIWKFLIACFFFKFQPQNFYLL